MAAKRSRSDSVGLHGSHVRHRSDSPVSKPSHFFKIILPSTIDDKKLMIPMKFIRRFGNDLAAKATINVPNGGTWQVGVDKVNRNIWFCDGWQELMEYYSVQYGYFLVFRYEGNSNFLVRVFDKSACEIDYPCLDKSNEVDPVLLGSSSEEHEQGKEADDDDDDEGDNDYNDDKDDDDEVLDSITSSQSRDNVNNISERGKLKKIERPHQADSLPNEGEFIVSKKLVYSKKSESAIHAARTHKPKNPSFMIVVKAGILRCQILTVPSEFVKKYMRSCLKLIKLQDSSGKQWPTKCHCYYNSSSARIIGKGLGVFFKDNNVKDGDVCVFELINKSNVAFKVSVYRVDDKVNGVETLKSRAPPRSKMNTNISKRGKLIKDSELPHQQDSLFKEDDQKIFVSRNLVYSYKSEGAIQAARNHKNRNPSFMVVLRQMNMYSFSLFVPSEFVKKYMWSCSEFIKIQDSSDNQWPVTCDFYTSSSSSKKISKGLRAFFEDNDLKEGDVCVFELMNNKDVLLKVWIYRIDDEEVKTDVGNDDDDDEMPHEDESNIFLSNRFVYSKKSEKAIHVTIKHEPKNPSFMVVLRPWNLNNSYVRVPSDFVNKHMWKCSEEIRIQDLSGKKWLVKCQLFRSSGSGKRLGKGLGAFFEDKNLKERDVCVFELMNKKEMKVWVYHVDDHTSSRVKKCLKRKNMS